MIHDVPSGDAYDSARHRAAIIDRSSRGRIVVSGKDRASYLQGLLTNDIVALTPGTGCYSAYLTAQGRMIADLYVYELGDVILLTMDGAVKNTVLAKFDQFIFSEDVQLGDVTDAFAQIAVVGPQAAAAIATVVPALEAQRLAALPEHANIRVDWHAEPAIVTRVLDTGEPGYDVFVDRGRVDTLVSSLEAAGAARIDEATADVLRIEAGVPVFHRDMDEDTIPLEAGIESRAISFTKGCYVGQEVIIRVLHRGHGRVARRLVGLVIDGDHLPAPGAPISVEGREIGRVTSSAQSPAMQHPIALGYVQRDFAQPGTAVVVDGAAATVSAVPVARG
jgi:folate-binding protein YgfZ